MNRKNKYTIVLHKYDDGTVQVQQDGGKMDFEYLKLQEKIIEINKPVFDRHPDLKRLKINVLETRVN